MIVLYVFVVLGGVLLFLGAIAKLVERRHRRKWGNRRRRPGLVDVSGFGEVPAGETPKVGRSPW